MITAIATFRPPRRLTIDEAKAIFQGAEVPVAARADQEVLRAVGRRHDCWRRSLSLAIATGRRRAVHRHLAGLRHREVRCPSAGHVHGQSRDRRQHDASDHRRVRRRSMHPDVIPAS